jgi:hypothetical protein
MILIIFLSRLFISLVAIDYVYKTCDETNLATLHYVTFIEPLVMFQTEACRSIP